MRTITSIIVLGMVAMATNAVADFYTGFENRELGPFPKSDDQEFRPLDPEEFFPKLFPQVVDSLDGVLPLAGKRMVSVRGWSVPGGATNLSPVFAFPANASFVQASVGIWFPRERIPGQMLAMAFDLSGGGGIVLDREKRKVKSLGTLFDLLDFDVPSLTDGAWNILTVQLERSTNILSFYVNGKTVFSKVRQTAGTDWVLRSFNLNLSQHVDLRPTYTLEEGAPGVLLDDFRISSVPEPTTMSCLAVSLATFIIRRRK